LECVKLKYKLIITRTLNSRTLPDQFKVFKGVYVIL
jgi:hypothetical protein